MGNGSTEIVYKIGAAILVVVGVPVGLVIFLIGGIVVNGIDLFGTDDPGDPAGWIYIIGGVAVMIAAIVGAALLAPTTANGERTKIGMPVLMCGGWALLNVTVILPLLDNLPSTPNADWVIAVSILGGLVLIVARVRPEVFWVAWVLCVVASKFLPAPGAWIIPIALVVVALTIPNKSAESDGSKTPELSEHPLGAEPPQN